MTYSLSLNWRESLTDLVEHISTEDAPELIGELARQQAVLFSRLAKPSQDAGELLTANEVANRLRLPLARVYELMRTDRLPHIKLGRQRRVSVSALENFLLAGGN